MRNPKAYYVRWEDVYTNDDWQYGEFEINPHIQYLVGWKMPHSNRRYVVFAQNISCDGGYFGVVVIPRSLIVEMTEVEMTETKEVKK